MVDSATLRAGLYTTLERTDFRTFGERYEGKVRDNYALGQGKRAIVVTDRISAFDRVLTTIPYKGQVLNTLSTFWFEKTASQVPNHLLSMPDPNVSVVTDCTPYQVEFVVRAYLTGVTTTSIWHHYQAGARTFCGHSLRDGMRKNQALPEPLLTPSTKAEKGGHDVSVSRDEVLARNLLTTAEFDQIAEYAMALFRMGQGHCAAQGLILVDTKYEFGKAADGRILLIDELHTPDSSRFWYRKSYEERLLRGEEPESMDKEYVRRFLAAQGYRGEGTLPIIPDDVRIEAARRYIEAYQSIRGTSFVPDSSAPIPRIEAALRNCALTSSS